MPAVPCPRFAGEDCLGVGGTWSRGGGVAEGPQEAAWGSHESDCELWWFALGEPLRKPRSPGLAGHHSQGSPSFVV